MITAGIDIGSLTGKSVILIDNEVASWSLMPTGYDSAETAQAVMDEALREAKLTQKQVEYTVSTGYGRVVVPFSNKKITEISCHAKGATWIDSSVRTILDMGGQDCKVIRCNEKGDIVSFAMNDRCAAGVGRYLEIMAEILEIPIDKIGSTSLEYEGNPHVISSMCTVFARSEMLRGLRQGVKKNNLLAGAHDALANKVLGMLNKIGIERELMISGGIAKNVGVIQRIQKILGYEVKIAAEPQIVGALGAALFARDFLQKGG
jgi:predicted CoA-substrate-specific enzyme activase